MQYVILNSNIMSKHIFLSLTPHCRITARLSDFIVAWSSHGPDTQQKYLLHVIIFQATMFPTFYAGPIAKPDNIEFEPSEGVMQVTWDDVNADQYEVMN